ncbi:DUF6437 family protein [Sphingomonas lenta]|uniref:DUF64370 domain-containing protein n=1 Tax=Sphingomonas lenta TaxID=1141887 RepID=A0A2A2SJ40_9SPHN|nr:DUF6437 family protein [Sphingomonas lenta]PAX09041.1 hypothetical protein CKY28_06845 [Sphingomonas lenta]
MAKKKPSALDALARHNDERRAMEDRGAELKRAAALELGLAVLDAGGAGLSLTQVRQAISSALGSGKKNVDRQAVMSASGAAPEQSGGNSHALSEEPQHG